MGSEGGRVKTRNKWNKWGRTAFLSVDDVDTHCIPFRYAPPAALLYPPYSPTCHCTRCRQTGCVLPGSGLPTLSTGTERSSGKQRMPGARLCAYDQSCASADNARTGTLVAIAHAGNGENLRARLNARYQRTGTLWEGRYKASLVQSDEYLLACQRYIELNPVRAGMVAAPGDYPYSSYRYHALGPSDPLLTPHERYLTLDTTDTGRRQAYRSLFRDTLSEELLTRLRQNTNACTVIGNDRFKTQIAAMLGRAVPTGKRGRPKKPQPPS